MCVNHLSIVLTTYARRDVIQRFFESLCAQTCRDFSVVLGDQNDADVLASLISKYEKKFSLLRVPLPRMSLSGARSALLPYAEGDFVALADDDCYYLPTTVEQLFQARQSTPEAAAFIGTMLPSPPEKPLPSGVSLCSRYSVCRKAPSWCLFIKKSLLHKIGDFDPDMGIGAPGPWQSAEETDVLVRIILAGDKVYRAKGVGVCHDPHNLCSVQVVHRAYLYGMGRMYLLHKHRFPLWFTFLNILFPCAQMPLVFFKSGWLGVRYCLATLKGRWHGFHVCRKQ